MTISKKCRIWLWSLLGIQAAALTGRLLWILIRLRTQYRYAELSYVAANCWDEWLGAVFLLAGGAGICLMLFGGRRIGFYIYLGSASAVMMCCFGRDLFQLFAIPAATIAPVLTFYFFFTESGREDEVFARVFSGVSGNKDQRDPPYAEPEPQGLLLGLKGEYRGAEFPLKPYFREVMGRDPRRCSILFRDSRISHIHCVITWCPNRRAYLIEDRSTNGVFRKNGQLLGRGRNADLTAGETFYVGSHGEEFEVL